MNVLLRLGLAGALFASASAAHATVAHFEGFEDPAWVANLPNNWQEFGGTIVRAPSGTGGIASSDGVAHATVDGSVFTRFGGYSSVFGAGFSTSLDVYLDPNAIAAGTGFDYTVAASRQSGSHLRDFIFHVGMDGTDLKVNASNNTDFGFNAFKLNNENGGNFFTVTSAGWYTLEHVFRDSGGALAVDFNLLDAGGGLLYSVTRSNAGDDIASTVGGNRYGWFTYNTIPALAIDNTLLDRAAVPEPGSLALLALGVAALGSASRRRRAA